MSALVTTGGGFSRNKEEEATCTRWFVAKAFRGSKDRTECWRMTGNTEDMAEILLLTIMLLSQLTKWKA